MINVDTGGETWYCFVFDGLSSVIALLNTSGSIVERYTYDAFGNTTHISILNALMSITHPGVDGMSVISCVDDEIVKINIPDKGP
jgi:YD repeat-containing protein